MLILRSRLKSGNYRASRGMNRRCEPTKLPKRLDRQSVEHYPGTCSTGEIWRTTPQPGHAGGDQRHFVRHSWRHPVANAAKGVSEVAECLLLLSDLA